MLLRSWVHCCCQVLCLVVALIRRISLAFWRIQEANGSEGATADHNKTTSAPHQIRKVIESASLILNSSTKHKLSISKLQTLIPISISNPGLISKPQYLTVKMAENQDSPAPGRYYKNTIYLSQSLSMLFDIEAFEDKEEIPLSDRYLSSDFITDFQLETRNTLDYADALPINVLYGVEQKAWYRLPESITHGQSFPPLESLMYHYLVDEKFAADCRFNCHWDYLMDKHLFSRWCTFTLPWSQWYVLSGDLTLTTN